MGGAVAVILIKERQVVEAFEDAGAIAPHRAIDPRDINVEEGGLIWRRLRNRAIVRESAPGLFYLDVEVWKAQRRTRLRLLSVVIVIVTLIAIGLLVSRGPFQ